MGRVSMLEFKIHLSFSTLLRQQIFVDGEDVINSLHGVEPGTLNEDVPCLPLIVVCTLSQGQRTVCASSRPSFQGCVSQMDLGR